jgi:aspartate carbamoyltransferase regulatory subunit
LYGSQINKYHISNNNGQRLRMPMSYYAMMAHLRIDRDYSITEPVANMIKGTLLGSSKKNLAYAPTSQRIELLRNVQINAVIDEPDGLYIIDQLTMYKKASKLSRGIVVKVLHRMRKDLPKLLKDLIQSKETSNVIDIAIERTYKYLNKYLVSPENYADGIFRTVNVNAIYNPDTYTLRLGVTVNPIGTIEIIDIPIIVI